MESKYRDTLAEIKTMTETTEQYKSDRVTMQEEIKDLSYKYTEVQRNTIEMEADQVGDYPNWYPSPLISPFPP